ncbi:MAG: hypothetical protein OWR52_06745 [Acidibacillus sp.]|nr:hypothetical protein [Acidibacillus sp.]
MYVYLLAPLGIALAVVLGYGIQRISKKTYAFVVIAIIALSLGEYFSGFFPTINILFALYLIVLFIVTWMLRLLTVRSFAHLSRNRWLKPILIAALVLLAFALFSGGAIIIFVIGWAIYRSRRQPRGPRPVGNQSNSILNAIESWRQSLARLGPIALLSAIGAISMIASSALGGAASQVSAASTYGAQVALVKAHIKASIPPVSATDVPIVERTNAEIVLSNSIGGLGTQYHVSNQGLSLVRYQGQLIWTAPLDYNNGLIWLTKHISPGYVWTSASNPSAKPVLVQNTAYTITPQAGFSDNLRRVLYQHFPTYYIGTSDWELNPNGQGYWVTSLYSPAPGLAGLVTKVIVGSALTNPTTGHVMFYPIGKQPAWVSQVVGPNFAQNEAMRFGWDRAGLFASTFTHQLTTEPVHATPYNVLLSNGDLAWEIPMTSPNSDDNSLSGLVIVNAQTNKVTYTPFTGLQNDLAAEQRINGSTLNSSLSAGRPLLYNISGQYAYIAPVVNQSGIIQEVALVDPRNTTQPIISPTMADALSSWQNYLATGGSTSSTSQASNGVLTATVQRIANVLSSSGANGAPVKEYWLFLLNGTSYRASLSLNPNIVPFVRPGDNITITFTKGQTAPITINSIKDNTLNQKGTKTS